MNPRAQQKALGPSAPALPVEEAALEVAALVAAATGAVLMDRSQEEAVVVCSSFDLDGLVPPPAQRQSKRCITNSHQYHHRAR